MLGRSTLAASAWFVLCSCFTGTFLAGQPCRSDVDCGPSLTCQDGVCGGRDATTTATTSTSPTTTTSTTTSTSTTTPTSASDETSSPTSGPLSSSSSTTSGTASTSSTSAGVETDTQASSTSETGGGCGLGRCKDIDMLLVIDDSGSMSDKKTVLSNALITVFTTLGPLLTQACSLHIGATTTDAYAKNPQECQTVGALVQADQMGTPCSFIEGHPYATLADFPNPFGLTCISQVGSGGSADETPLDALLSVFNPNLAACNDGFIREDAQLIIVLLTDEEDDDKDAQGHNGSGVPAQSWKTALKTLKPEADTYFVGILGDGNPVCAWMPIYMQDPDGDGAEDSPLLRGLVQSYPAEQHLLASICELDVPALAALETELVQEVAGFCGA